MEPVIVLLFVLLVCQGCINGEESSKDSSHRIRRQINPYWQNYNYNRNYETSTRSIYDEIENTNYERNVNIDNFLKPVNLQDFMTKMVPLFEQTMNTFHVEHDNNKGPERFTQPLRQYFHDKMKRKRIAEKYLIDNYMTPKTEIEYDQYPQTLPNPLVEIKDDTSSGVINSNDNNVAFTEYEDSVTQYDDQSTTIQTDFGNSAWSWLRPEPLPNKENNQFYSSFSSTPTLHETTYDQNPPIQYSIENDSNNFYEDQNKYNSSETYEEDISIDTRIFEENDDSNNTQESSDYPTDNSAKDAIYFKDRSPFLAQSTTDRNNPEIFDSIVTLHDIEITSYPTEELNVHIIKGFSLASRDVGDFPYSNYTVEDILEISDRSLIPSVTQKVDKIQITQLPYVIKDKENKNSLETIDLFGEANENKYSFKELRTTDGYTITDEDKVNIQNLPHGKITKKSNEELHIDVIKGFVLSSSNDEPDVSKKDVASTIEIQNFPRENITIDNKYPIDDIEEVETKDYQEDIEPSPTIFNMESTEGTESSNYKANISMSKYEIKPSEKLIFNYTDNSRNKEFKKIYNQKETTPIDEIYDVDMTTVSGVNIKKISDNMKGKNGELFFNDSIHDDLVVNKTEKSAFIEANIQNEHNDSYIVFKNKTGHVPEINESQLYSGNGADQMANEKAIPFVEDNYTMSIIPTSEYYDDVTDDYQSVYSGKTDNFKSLTEHVPVVTKTQSYHKHMNGEVTNRTSFSTVKENYEMKTQTSIEYDEKNVNKDSPVYPVIEDALKKNTENNHVVTESQSYPEDITDNILNEESIPIYYEFNKNSTTVRSDEIANEKILPIVEEKYEMSDISTNAYDEDMDDENRSVFSGKEDVVKMITKQGSRVTVTNSYNINDEISNEKSLSIFEGKSQMSTSVEYDDIENHSVYPGMVNVMVRVTEKNPVNTINILQSSSEKIADESLKEKSLQMPEETDDKTTTIEYYKMTTEKPSAIVENMYDMISNEKSLPIVKVSYERTTIPTIKNNENIADKNHSVMHRKLDVLKKTENKTLSFNESESFSKKFTDKVSIEKSLLTAENSSTVNFYEMSTSKGLPYATEYFEMQTSPSVEYVAEENRTVYSRPVNVLERTTQQTSADTESKSYLENITVEISNEKLLSYNEKKYETTTSENYEMTIERALPMVEENYEMETYPSVEYDERIVEEDHSVFFAKDYGLEDIAGQVPTVIELKSYYENTTDIISNEKTLPILEKKYEMATNPSLKFDDNIAVENSSVYPGKADVLQRLVELPLIVGKLEPYIKNISDKMMKEKASLTVQKNDEIKTNSSVEYVDNITDENPSVYLKTITAQAHIVTEAQSYDKNITDEMTIPSTLPIAGEIYETNTFIENNETKFEKTVPIFEENYQTNSLLKNNKNMADETRSVNLIKKDSLEKNTEKVPESTKSLPNHKTVTDEMANQKSLPFDEESFEMRTLSSVKYNDKNSVKNRSSYSGKDIIEDFTTANNKTLETERSTIQSTAQTKFATSTMETILESIMTNKGLDMITEDSSIDTQKSINPDYESKSSNFTDDYGNESLFEDESDLTNDKVVAENLRSLSNSVSNNQYSTQEGHHIDTTVQYDNETERYLYLELDHSSPTTTVIKSESTSDLININFSDKQETPVSEEALAKNLELDMVENNILAETSEVPFLMITTTEIPFFFDEDDSQTTKILTILPKEEVQTTVGTNQIADSFLNMSRYSQFQNYSKGSDETSIEDTIKSLKGITDLLKAERNDTASVRGRSIGNVNINSLNNKDLNRYNAQLESMRIGGINNYVNKTGKDITQFKADNEVTKDTIVHIPEKSDFKNDVDKENVSVHRRSDIEISDDDYEME